MADCFIRADCSIRVYQSVSYTSTEIHFLPVRESYIHALSRNTKCLTIDGQICFYKWPFADVVEPRGWISWP